MLSTNRQRQRAANRRLKKWNIVLDYDRLGRLAFYEEVRGIKKTICLFPENLSYSFPLRFRHSWQAFLKERAEKVYKPDSVEELADLMKEVNAGYKEELNFYLKRAGYNREQFAREFYSGTGLGAQ